MNIFRIYRPHTRSNAFPWFRIFIDPASIGYWWNPEIFAGRTWPVNYPQLPKAMQRVEDNMWHC